jgi:hypothetical protein
MDHFKEYFTFIQKFDLRLSEMRDKRKSSKAGPVTGLGYSIKHQNPYFSFEFRQRLRILKELALIDIFGVDKKNRGAYLGQTKKLLIQFNRFWENYFNHNPTAGEVYRDDFLLVIEFGEIFYTNILEPGKVDVIVTPEFVDDLCDSVREREESLAQFIEEINAPGDMEEHDIDQPQTAHDAAIALRVRRFPVFVEGIAEQFFRIFKEYFDEQDQQPLFSLLTTNAFPKRKLLFNSNGNQLADAFKQLIEGNLIVSCNKAELESWIIEHFRYVSNGHAKSFTAGYLNGIISSDVKICKSPVMTVSRDSSSDLTLIPIGRNKRGSEGSI